MIKKFKEYLKEEYNLNKSAKKDLKKVLDKDKQKHSLNVKNYLCQLDCDDEVEQAAIFHDFIEQGGSNKKLNKYITKKAKKYVNILTHDEDANVVNDFKNKTKKLSNKDKIKVFNIKLADRADNFNKRIKNNDLSNEYINKTYKLLKYIIKSYPGDQVKLNKFINSNFTSKCKKLSKLLKL
jgi:(p)ppGpp synthase/HD superfamily hydrolase